MNATSPCPKDSPLMVAWEAHKATDEYKNSLSWATRFIPPDDPSDIEKARETGANPVTRAMKEQYIEGSLWAQFSAGFLAVNPHGAYRPSEPSPPADRREIVARIINAKVGSKANPHFVERRWLTGVDEAADAILTAIRRLVSGPEGEK